MGKKLAKLLIQLFAEEESETTDLTDDVITESEENFTEDEEEASSEAEEEESETTDKESETTAKEPEKVKSLKKLLKEHPEYQDEMNDMMESRAKRERNAVDRKYREKLSKYEEMAYLTKEGLKAESFDDALGKARDFYGKQGIKYNPGRSAREEEILATAEAQEILSDCENTDDIESEVQRLLSKGNNISNREKSIAQKLTDELTNRVRISELSKLGVKPEVYESKEFRDFEKHFTKETPISFIYEQYRVKNKTNKEISNPGSMKSILAKEKKTFISEADYDKMTEKEIEANLDLIKESMSKW